MRTLKHTALLADEGRVDALVARLLAFPRARARGLIDHGGVSLNGEPCQSAATPIKCGDEVLLRYEPERKYKERANVRAPQGFTVAYLDEFLVVVVKASGILTVPTDRGERNTLVDRAQTHLAMGRPNSKRLGVVHRLDRETSGLLVLGRTPDVTRNLIAQFAARKPEREYMAIVAGRVVKDNGEVRSHLVTDKALNQKSVSRRSKGGDRSGDGGELAITHYEVLERFSDATLVRVRLETGRRNQIRVHFAELGHPVLGDQRYRPEVARHSLWPYARLALHARTLGFRHPVDGREMRFTADPPREFLSFQISARS